MHGRIRILKYIYFQQISFKEMLGGLIVRDQIKEKINAESHKDQEE